MAKTTQPTMTFHDKASIKKCLAKWQKILYLDDWFINVYLVRPEDLAQSDYVGQNSFSIPHKTAEILILRPEYYGQRTIKYCAEQILIHELLHCKYNWLRMSDTAEGNFTDTMLHQRLEEMSRSLIIARYNLKPEWFRA